MKMTTPEKEMETKIVKIKLPRALFERISNHCVKTSILVDDFILDAVAEKLELVNKERRRRPRL